MNDAANSRAKSHSRLGLSRELHQDKIAPIEYIFCELACELDMRIKRNWNVWDLRHNISDIMNTS